MKFSGELKNRGIVSARAWRKPAASIVLALLILTSSACTNNLLKSATSLLDNAINAAQPNGGEGDNTSGLILTRVQKNNFDPGGTLDLLGDGTHSMGTFCQPKTGGAAGASTCTCAMSYIMTDGTSIGPVEVDTTYLEKDQIRCSYATIPSDVPYIKVYIHLTNSDTKSNQVTFQFTGTGVSLDLSNPASFSQVQRYQCRDIVYIPYLWDSSVYDPFLSEDAQYSYPLNFYTTNMGGTLARYASSSNPTLGWNCPAMPNDTTAGMDLTLYSVAADSTGSKAIYPPAGAFDRSTFFVAKAKSGIFNVPVNAYNFPGTATQTQPAPPAAPVGVPPIGYAASAVITTSGAESCPDTSVTIPSGFHWAKLWLFRKQLPQRRYPVSNKLLQLGQISCNPGEWGTTPAPAAPYDNWFTDCSGTRSIASLGGGLATRFLEGTAMCVDPDVGGTTDPLTTIPYVLGAGPNASVDYSVYPTGADIWNLPPQGTRDPRYGCSSGTNTIDPTGVCESAYGNVPSDSSNPIGQGDIDASVATSPRFDYLFVVSPPSVTVADMAREASGTTHSVYTPMRFLSPNDCRSSDPDQPTGPGDCSPARMLTYGLKRHEVGAPGNPGQDDPNRPGDFPMCVLQPN